MLNVFACDPDLARLIRHHRSIHPVKWLSDRLTNAEGEFFIDGVLPFVVDAGIPALPIHDAVVVPASAAEQVKRWCCDLAQARFGFAPKFKITNGAAA